MSFFLNYFTIFLKINEIILNLQLVRHMFNQHDIFNLNTVKWYGYVKKRQ
jgi:hypothetical protein